MRKPLVISFLILTSVAATLVADDWPQWRGPERDDVSTETGLLESWPEQGPQRLWLYEQAGAGYSGFAIQGGTLYTMGTSEGSTVLIALDAASGDKRWTTPMGELLTNGWGDGPRGTPTLDENRVYALSGRGELVCANAADGSIVWQRTMADFGGRKPKWGYTESVLIDGDKLVCTPGDDEGAIVALNKMTGEKIWQSEEVIDWAQYSSVISLEFNGQRQYVQLFMKRVVGVSADAGTLLWEHPFDGQIAVVPTPIYRDGKVYVCAGYGVGCKLISLAGTEPQEVYANKVMKNHHGGVILVGDRLYGYSDKVGWVCQDFESGETVWKQRKKLGKGAVAYADGKLYCLSERTGTVCLIDATDSGWQERGRFTLDPTSENRSARGAIWTHPVIANGRLYLRDQEFIYCYDVSS